MKNSDHPSTCQCGPCSDKRRASAVQAAKELPKTGCVQEACSDSSYPADDPEYQTWMDECAAECNCCHECGDIPCDSLMAGGPCDNRCNCDNDREYDESL